MRLKQENSSFLDAEHLDRHIRQAVDMSVRALAIFGPSQLAFSFNGGKDSTVVLHVLLQAVQEWQQAQGHIWEARHGLLGIHTFFFLGSNEFPEVSEFVQQSNTCHHLNMHTYTCGFKEGLHEMVEQRSIKAIFLGTRHGDPNCKDQDFYCPSSAGWPPFIRINPILNWSYSDVWAFLRSSDAEFCSLYLQGYTSLGSTADTSPNKSLLRADGTYAPAHQLHDERLERNGRTASPGALRQNSCGAEHAPAAAVVVIGDEILSGKVTDSNTPFLAAELHRLGWKVSKVVVLPDSVNAIARELEALMEAQDVVITCGGVGPTVDDCTLEAVAMAANTHLATDRAFEASLRKYFGDAITESHLKMAQLPQGCSELIEYRSADGALSAFPLLKVRNIFVLPGVPGLVRAKWRPLREQLLAWAGHQTSQFHNRLVQVKVADEARIASVFEALVQEFPDVAAGSYPKATAQHGDVVMISLEAKDQAQVDGAANRYQELLAAELGSEGHVLAVHHNSAALGDT